MKLIINYDLLDRIREAKTGISLHRTTTKILIGSGIVLTLSAIIDPFLYPSEELLNEFLKTIPRSICFQTFFHLLADAFTSKFSKFQAKESLKILSSVLKEININTNEDLMLKASKYKTEYKFEKNDDSTDLVQKKYIIVPVIENGEENEVSILQEHIIGSKTYTISIGEPKKQKVYKLAFGSM